MKKFLLTFAFVLCAFSFFNIIKAEACVAPVERLENGKVELYKANDIIMQYIKINIEVSSVQEGYDITIEAAIKNKNMEAVSIMLGVPQYFKSGLSASSYVTMACNGDKIQAIRKIDAEKNLNLDDDQPYYTSYYCGSIDIAADDVAYVYITLSLGTRHYPNETQCLDLPMDVLQYWADEGGIGEIIIDSSFIEVYSYDMLGMQPTSISSDGVMTWKNGLSLYKSNLELCHSLDDRVLAKFFKYKYTTGVQGDAAKAFSAKKYSDAIKLIDENGLLESSDSSALDFSFMKMVCFEKLGYEDEARDILKKIYANPKVCFDENSQYDISEYVSKRMIFAQYMSMSDADKMLVQEKRDMLSNSIKNLTQTKSSSFIMWANNEISALDKLLGASGQQSNSGTNVIPGQGTMTQTPWVSKISEPVIITVGIVIVVVVVFCLTGMFTGTSGKSGKSRNYKKR